VAFIPVHGSEIEEEAGSSRSNMDEAAVVLQVVKDLLLPGDLDVQDIGVISPYAGQVRLIREMLGEDLQSLEIKSVDGYQGREKEVIVLSTVRSNEDGVVGFLSNFRRLNVALTRARRGLIVIGDDRTLRNDSTWESWLDWVDESKLMAWHVVNS